MQENYKKFGFCILGSKQDLTLLEKWTKLILKIAGWRPCLDAVKAKHKFFVNRLHAVLNVVEK